MVSDIVVNFNDWRMREYRQFNRALKEGDLEAVFQYASRVVQSWPFEGSPDSFEAYDDLKPEQWRDVMEAISKGLQDRFAQGN